MGPVLVGLAWARLCFLTVIFLFFVFYVNCKQKIRTSKENLQCMVLMKVVVGREKKEQNTNFMQ